MDLHEAVTYRMAYGLAGDLAEGADANHTGRWRSNAAAGGELSQILAEVLRRLNVVEGEATELVREAVEDALEGR
jgi:hypothetical protein